MTPRARRTPPAAKTTSRITMTTGVKVGVRGIRPREARSSQVRSATSARNRGGRSVGDGCMATPSQSCGAIPVRTAPQSLSHLNALVAAARLRAGVLRVVARLGRQRHRGAGAADDGFGLVELQFANLLCLFHGPLLF